MKAWRRNNMQIAAKVKQLKSAIANAPIKFHRDELEQKLQQVSFMRIKRSERRTHFAPEVSQPSTMLYTLMFHAGLQVPATFVEALFAKVINDGINEPKSA